jgi:hypothetical protein
MMGSIFGSRQTLSSSTPRRESESVLGHLTRMFGIHFLEDHDDDDEDSVDSDNGLDPNTLRGKLDIYFVSNHYWHVS